MIHAGTAPQRWWGSPEGSLRARTRWMLMLGAFGFVFLTTFAGFGWLFTGLGLVVAGGVWIWRHPFGGVVALLVVGLFHQFLMLLVFALTGPGLMLKLGQAWKEAVVILLLVRALDMAFRRHEAPRIRALDLVILVFLVYTTAYVFYPSSLEESSLTTALFGLRADTFFLLPYFVGRAFPFTVRQVGVLITLLIAITIINGVTAAAQFASPHATNAIFDVLGFSAYLEAQRGDKAVTTVIRENAVSGAIIPRAAGFLLSDLALAFYSLLAVPIVGAFFFTRRKIEQLAVFNVFLLVALGSAVLSITRSAMIALGPVLLAVAARSGRLPLLLVIGFQGLLVAIPIAYTMDVTPQLLRDIFSPNEGSAQGHVTAIQESLAAIREEPFGRGLGTSGAIAQRFAPVEGMTNESWYLQIATEIGVAGGLMWALVIFLFCAIAFQMYGRVRDPALRCLCLGMGGASIGFILVSVTLHAWEALTVSMVFWLFAGIVVSAQDIEARSGSAG
jgi:hypothetical protein